MTTTEHRPGTYENHGQLFPIPITFNISQYEIVNVIIGAIEGGYYGILNQWCKRVELQDSDIKAIEWDSTQEVWNEYIARNVAMGGTLTFFEDGETDDVDDTPHTLTREKLLGAFGKIFQLGLFMNRIEEVLPTGETTFDLDGPMCDVLIQLALFDEIVYG